MPPSGGTQQDVAMSVFAVEVAGRDETENELKQKARWYLESGVVVVWIVLLPTREIVVVTVGGESRHGRGSVLPPVEALPGLSMQVDRAFRQLDP